MHARASPQSPAFEPHFPLSPPSARLGARAFTPFCEPSRHRNGMVMTGERGSVQRKSTHALPLTGPAPRPATPSLTSHVRALR